MPRKGRREEILETGLSMASEVGLLNLTIGGLADEVGLSKAGLYAHFASKQDLLREVLRTAVDRFVEQGLQQAMRAAPGAPRLRALFEAWLEWTQAPPLPGGCVLISSAVELDDRPGPLRDYLVDTQRKWMRILVDAVESAREEGHLRTETDARQFVFELYGIVLAFHYHDRLFEDPEAETHARRAFEERLESMRPADGSIPGG